MIERDFMGLNSNESAVEVKEDINDEASRNSVLGIARGAGGHWPFLNKVPALSHLTSFKAVQEDQTKKKLPESFLSSGNMPVLTTCETQKYFNHDRDGGTHFSLTAYPMQHDVPSVQRPYDVRMVSVTSHGTSVPVVNSYSRNYLVSMGHSFAVTTPKQQLLGGVPVATPYAVLPSSGSVVGTTEPWNNVKTSGNPSQLTIFYAGTVNVYNDITPEKAQAMMFLAQNGSSIPSNGAQANAQAPTVRMTAEDGFPGSQPIYTIPSALSSPLSVSSHTGAQSRSGSTSTDEHVAAKTTGLPTTPVSKVEPPKTSNEVGSVARTAVIHSAIPQARKASLARFLGKRKERVINSAPYNLSKKCPEVSNAESNGQQQ